MTDIRVKTLPQISESDDKCLSGQYTVQRTSIKKGVEYRESNKLSAFTKERGNTWHRLAGMCTREAEKSVCSV